ncbi:hypothetical protein FXV83_30995 [Bradyrhizobium hipponense]|uniref:Uncharacterized protein n=1 Tax=Bradyrhizobium hipponense TaxID=2605638 RepID=A0A5S4YFF9_9BRAD|nr:hypothetical protein FXV83_30995 [Bradyrhizobium hipponense]
MYSFILTAESHRSRTAQGRRRERIVLVASCRGDCDIGEGTSAGKCGQIGAAPTRSGLPWAFLGRCKGLILRHNSGIPRFAGSCCRPASVVGVFPHQKHCETLEISIPITAGALGDAGVPAGQALNLTPARNTKPSMWRDVLCLSGRRSKTGYLR